MASSSPNFASMRSRSSHTTRSGTSIPASPTTNTYFTLVTAREQNEDLEQYQEPEHYGDEDDTRDLSAEDQLLPGQGRHPDTVVGESNLRAAISMPNGFQSAVTNVAGLPAGLDQIQGLH